MIDFTINFVLIIMVCFFTLTVVAKVANAIA